jgi:hypothetical protein
MLRTVLLLVWFPLGAVQVLAGSGATSWLAATAWWIRRGGSNADTEGGTFQQRITNGLNLVLASNCPDGASPVPWPAVEVGAERGLTRSE